MTQIGDEALMALFGAAYTAVATGMPFTHYEKLCELLVFANAPNITTKYDDPRALGRFTACIHDYYQGEQTKRLKNATFIGIQMDESTCIAGESHAAICVIYDEPSTGTIFEEYFGLVKLSGWTGRDLYDACSGEFRRRGVDLEKKLASFSGDGCSAVASEKKGVFGFFRKEVNSACYGVHCASHRLALCVKDAGTKRSSPKMLRDAVAAVDTVIRAAHKVFSKSPERWLNYLAVREVIGALTPARTLKVFNATRWSGRFKCIEDLLSQLPEFLSFLCPASTTPPPPPRPAAAPTPPPLRPATALPPPPRPAVPQPAGQPPAVPAGILSSPELAEYYEALLHASPAVRVILLQQLGSQESVDAILKGLSTMFQIACAGLGVPDNVRVQIVNRQPLQESLKAQVSIIDLNIRRTLSQLAQAQQATLPQPPPPPPPPPPPAAPPPMYSSAYATADDSDSDYDPSDTESVVSSECDDDGVDVDPSCGGKPADEAAKFASLHEKLTDFTTLAFTHFLADVLGTTDAMFKLMQASEFKFSDVPGCVEGTKNALHACYVAVEPGEYLTLALSAFFAEMKATGFGSYKGHAIHNVPAHPEAEVHKLVSKYAANLIRHVNERFPDTRFISALALFDPLEYPDVDQPSLVKWGIEKLNVIHEYFTSRSEAKVHTHECHPVISFGQAKAELVGFLVSMQGMKEEASKAHAAYVQYFAEERAVLSQLLDDASLGYEAAHEVAQKVSRNRARPQHHLDVVIQKLWGLRRNVPQLYRLALFVAMIKPTTVNCERVFSMCTVLKTELHTRHSVTSLDQSLFIKLNTSGSVMKEHEALAKAVIAYHSGTKIHLYQSIAAQVENINRDPRVSHMLVH
ncbi:hypothetical protein VOLCADRAFT_86010 [Volvox carteri f. nagariensis]|uniref:HAT C-terminal dimerisation domain-containing protein n=1 Tax=Volvox carteri f. nagariensis TaxID=3068 RepID=D8THL2_VOLCA|nr:uncharacterized protein VOLCADRAFT_86010 [Volvox carteri f. nagariensis]EFJ53090.1 hypothetical protein VOLCADRAFT_86010 [Volvox carteri f. nagariensis]|eukprot:XP_002946095.1 hypothetical protein VOLCADRAFT_86010 [Volvox carteri f. nagariensis]